MFPNIKVDKKSKDGKDSGRIKVQREPNYNIKQHTMDIKTDPAKIKIEWYSEESKKSKFIKNEFTNHVDDLLTDVKVENAVDVLNNDLESLVAADLPSVDIKNNEEGERLKEIINLYFDFGTQSEKDFWFVRATIKTDLQTILNDSGPVRVVMINMKDMTSGEHFLQVIFIDLYHLFVLSKHNGMSQTENKKLSYKKHEKLDVCLSKHLK